ncbi:alpha/beta hydrolase [Algiphilus sp. NNCM1]|uniref:alpha/beta hydrolase n=1 Tax=Algiphilus sp. TaxID=1872431 RepID=UPI001CA6E1FA|nr:alpha/beta hydrolase [Algiphilus sp.]MBY8965561.1 alpha/beta hydrolase [Algiphilus acroporae]MCI5064071.1 alpha/beta hydrolase [Algiphilus sp.]MCI5104061.1 alpha/beta hydrolase [Algiphilus sp.]
MRLLTVLMLSVLVTACSGLSLLNAVTPDRGYEAAANIAYASGEGRRLDIYAPKNLDQRAPVVVFFYGGRWSQGSKDEYKFVGEALSSRGIIAVVADYRKYPDVRMAGFMDDAAKAVAWVHDNISSYGGDAQKLFVMGHSSGAHMAALLALDDRYLDSAGMRTPLAGFIGLAGAYDFLPIRAADLQDIFGPASRYPMSQPVNFAHGEAPPSLLIHSKDDATTVLSNASNLAQALRGKGAAVTTVFYESIKCSPGVSSHACTVAVLARPFRTSIDVLDQITGFIEAQAGTPEQTPSTPAPMERSAPRALGEDNVELKE